MATSGFNPASEQDVFSIEEPHQSISRLASTLTGQEARQFYEDLAKHEKEESGKMDKESKRKDRCKTRESKRRERHRAVAVQVNPSRTTESGGTSSAGRSGELQGLRLLRCAHQGDTSALKDLLSKGADVNFQVLHSLVLIICFGVLMKVCSLYVSTVGFLLLDSSDVCELVGTQSGGEAAAGAGRGMGRSGGSTGQGRRRPSTGGYCVQSYSKSTKKKTIL